MEDIILEYNNHKKNVILNHFNNIIVNQDNEKGNFKLSDNKLQIIWDNNEDIKEIFIFTNTKNNIHIYKNIEINKNKIYIINNNIEDLYILNDKEIFKNNKIIGKYYYINYFLTIEYLDLKKEIYINIDDKYYLKSLYEKKIHLYYYKDDKIINTIFYMNDYNKYIYDEYDVYNECGNFILVNNILNIYWHNNFNDHFMIEETSNYYYSEYLLNNIFKKILIHMNNDIQTYLIYKDRIFHFNKYDIIHKYYYIDETKFGFDNNIFELENNIYYDKTIKYCKNIELVHNEWNDSCIINILNNYLYRLSNKEECGKYNIINNSIIIYWEKWNTEVFECKDNIYYYKDKYSIEILIIHSDWTDICFIDNDKIYRKSIENEVGKYLLESDKLVIYWEKWNENVFYKCDKDYYDPIYLICIFINNIKYILNTFNNKIYENSIHIGYYIKYDTTIHIVINNILKIYFYTLKSNNITLYDDMYKEIIIHKYFDEIYKINVLTNEIFYDNKKMDYLNFEEYSLYNNKYYFKEYLHLHNKEIYLIDNILNEKYYHNYIDNYFYNNNKKLRFLQDDKIYYVIQYNRIFKYYYLYEHNILLIHDLYMIFISFYLILKYILYLWHIDKI